MNTYISTLILVDLPDDRRAAKKWLPEDDRDVTNGHVYLDGHGKPACRLYGAMNRVDAHALVYRCMNERCGVGAQLVPDGGAA
jgi:hypothetical protein